MLQCLDYWVIGRKVRLDRRKICIYILFLSRLYYRNPPTIRIDKQYPLNDYPAGEIQLYKLDKANRTTLEEFKEKDKLMDHHIISLRKVSEVHRQVRKYAQSIIRPGVRLIDICEKIEDMNRYLVRENGLEAGIAFPTGCSLNYVAAHYTPNNGDFTRVEYDDVCKV